MSEQPTIEARGPIVHGVECYEAWRDERDCPHEVRVQPIAVGSQDEDAIDE